MKVIGAGFGRTGTRSLKIALDDLGFGATLHQQEIIESQFLTRAWIYKGYGGYIPWEALTEGYASAVDWPVSSYWLELAAYYPDAKVILTVRPVEQWYRSFAATILPKLREIQAENHPDHYIIPCVIERVFGGDLSSRNVFKAYRRHIDDVVEAIPRNRLLVFDISEGWAPLCRFLGVSVPEIPFPHDNTTEQFLGRVRAREAA